MKQAVITVKLSLTYFPPESGLSLRLGWPQMVLRYRRPTLSSVNFLSSSTMFRSQSCDGDDMMTMIIMTMTHGNGWCNVLSYFNYQ